MDIISNVKRVILKEGPGVFDILMFYPLPDEVSLLPLFYELVSFGHHVYFPVTGPEKMDFFEVTVEDSMTFGGASSDEGYPLEASFVRGRLGVMEPRDQGLPYVYGARQTICLTPGTLFSEKCQRRGRGKGYYDRFLSDKPDIFKIGVTTDALVVSDILTHTWDVDMDAVVTESRIISKK